MELQNPSCNLCTLSTKVAGLPRQICLMDTLVEADVMIVAENPMTKDDLQARAFVSPGLSNIKKYFEDLGLTVYFTYATKCLKPSTKGFKITDSHIKTCSTNYLKKEISIVKPKHIITLGAGALYAVTGKKGLENKRGLRVFDETLKAYIYPTLHQAQALYDEQKKVVMYEDLVRFGKWIQNGEEAVTGLLNFNPPVYVVDTLAGLRRVQHLIRQANNIVAIDTETNGLNQFAPTFKVRCIQFCWDTAYGGVFVPLELEPEAYFTDKEDTHSFWDGTQVDLTTGLTNTLDNAIRIIEEILGEAKAIWHNGKFDRIALHMWGERRFGRPILCPFIYMDSMHVAHLLDENRMIGLKKLIVSELGYPSYDIPDKVTLNLDILIPYATKDTVASLLLAKKFLCQLGSPGYERLLAFYKAVIRRVDKYGI